VSAAVAPVLDAAVADVTAPDNSQPFVQRLALGLSYRGSAYHGWQSQADGMTLQDKLESALSKFADQPVRTICAGRTDTGVHALNQVIHIDAPVDRKIFSWVRGTNRFLPADMAVQWCLVPDPEFHARYSALGRRYTYVLRESIARPALESGMVGWVFKPLDADLMNQAAALLIGEHDFSAFRSSECQAPSPIKQMRSIRIRRKGAYWRFDFDASAYLHHMVRNIMGCLVAVGTQTQTVAWLADVLAAGERHRAAPTFAPDGLYFVGPYYDARFGIPQQTLADDWLP
jgi:tRNA pseudouridine38-40 synthase